MAISYRPATDADRSFVVSSWSSSFRTSYTAGLISMDRWAAVMHAEIGDYLDRPTVQTVVATERKDPSFLYGFLTADMTPQLEITEDRQTREWPALVYYAFVKAPYRRRGIARGLFEALGLDPRTRWLYACKTPIVGRLGGKIPMAKWNPLVARFGKDKAA